MSRHEITADEIDAFLADHWLQYAASFGEGTQKSFEVNSKGERFRVKNFGACIYDGVNKADAVKHYNSAP